MLSFINDINRYYIVAPANFATGGPELLHQLGYKLKQNGKNVSIFYFPSNHPNPVHINYKQYDLNFVREIDDDDHNILLVPETNTNLFNNYKKIKKIIWWLSVDHYFLSLPGLKGIINRFILKRFNSQSFFFFNNNLKNLDFHLVQSEYAKDCLIKNGINNIELLTDYLHESFLNIQVDIHLKKNIVAYNPKKGYDFTQKLIKKFPNINFIAIENMTRDEVVNLLLTAKVYIDFGFHPGKDRIPREAALLSCCVITNNQGSAKFHNDLPINEEFKFKKNNDNLFLIRDKIEDCFINYLENLGKFEKYRHEIIKQELNFEEQLNNIFF